MSKQPNTSNFLAFIIAIGFGILAVMVYLFSQFAT